MAADKAADKPIHDPYAAPERRGIDRRQFVKAAMGAAAVGAIGATTAGLVVPLSTSGRLNIRRFPYLGAKKIGGPAPQGVPLIPVRVNAAGFVEGVPRLIDAPMDHSLEWYRYCGHEQSPAFEEGFTQDNVLRYFNNPIKLQNAAKELGAPLWYADKLNQSIRASDFTEVGQGAPFRWRSETLQGNDIVTGIIVKLDPAAVKGKDASAFMADGLLAVSSYCAHFCCVPGYKESVIPREKGLFEKIYCTCHDSVYDPSDIAEYTFPPNL